MESMAGGTPDGINCRMAFFVALVDSDPARRESFLSRVQDHLKQSGLPKAASARSAAWVVVSSVQPWEPFRYGASDRGEYCVWGNALDCRAQPPDRSPELSQLWQRVPQEIPPVLEGFHAALLCRSDRSVIAGSDLLGVTPVYYYAGPDFLLAGSSPQLFQLYSRFQPRLDPAGLAGLLLTNGLIDGRTLLQGVRRLSAGHLLHWSAHAGPREIAQYRIPVSDSRFGAAYEENRDRLEGLVEDSFRRHLKADGSYGLLMSGGLDSRLVGGFLRDFSIRPVAVTFGAANDVEMKCAALVARELGFEHHPVPVELERYPEYAENESKWRGLANGFSCVMFWQPVPYADRMTDGLLSGFAMECVTAGDHIKWAGPSPEQMSFERFFARMNRWGVRVPAVKKLLGPRFGKTLVDDVIARAREIYHSYSRHEFQRAWCFDLHHRIRFHTSAALGFHSRWPWPVAPYVDSSVLDFMAGVPYGHMEGRRAQFDWLKSRFPDLARIPLDRNSFNMKPVLPRYTKLGDHLIYKARETLYRWTSRHEDNLFYYRAMDFNGPGWKRIRERAESQRERLAGIFDPRALSEVLPPPHANPKFQDGILDSSEAKLVTGLMFWSESAAEALPLLMR